MRMPEWARRRLLTWALSRANRDPDFIIGSDKDPYLLRWWAIVPDVVRMGLVSFGKRGYAVFKWLGRNPIFTIYVHKGLRDDEDRAEHCHPGFSVSLIGAVGYVEIMKGVAHIRREGDIVFRTPWTRHRLVMHRDENGKIIPGVSIFIFFFKFWSWGFYCPNNRYVSWYDFVDTRDHGNVGRGCGEMS